MKYEITPDDPETRLTLRVSESMKRDLKIAAAKAGRDMTEIVRDLVTDYLTEHVSQ